jgi:hypothetical protein
MLPPYPVVYVMGAALHGQYSSRRRAERDKRMARLRVKFTYSPDTITEPIIWEVGKRFDLVTNIRRADVTAEVAWAILELDGDQADLERGLDWVRDRGVRVDPVEDSILEG